MPSTLIDVAPAYEVMRPFTALGRELVRGEIVECSTWRNVQPLINTRYLKPLWAHVAPDGTGTADAPLPPVSTTVAPEVPVSTTVAPEVPVHRGPGRPRKDAA